MRQHTAVLLLLARSTLYPVLGLLALLGLVEWGLFSRALDNSMFMNQLLGNGPTVLEPVIEASGLGWALAVGFLALSALLCASGCVRGTRSDYTLRRLSLPEWTIFLWQGAYNSACLLLLWASQATVALGLSAWFTARTGADSLAVFLAFYRDPIFHSLLPLEDGWVWARNLVICLELGIIDAFVPYQQRRGRPVISIVAWLGILWTIGLFPDSMGNEGLLWHVFMLAIIVFFACRTVFFPKREENDETD